MSTKIYEGYRFPASRLNEFMDIIGQEVAKQFVEWCGQFTGGKVELSETLFELLKLLDLASDRPEKSMWDIDTSWNFWIHEDEYVYAIPYGRFRAELPEWVGDFCYWNNTDKPDDVGDATWRFRGKMWEEVCLNNWNSRRLSWEIIKGSSESIGMNALWKETYEG